jgi:hypothetical protein
MEFWWGLTVGIFTGANIGIVIAGLLAGSKRKELSQEYLWDQLLMDRAVMDETPVQTPRAARLITGAPADPASHSTNQFDH